MVALRSHETGPEPDGMEPALLSLFSHLRFWVVAGALLWLDMWSKSWVFHHLNASEIHDFIPDVVVFRRSLNDGAVFGLFSGYTSVFIIASVFALGLMFYLFAHSDRRQRILHIALGLILAGALGNLYDRAFIKADVVRPIDNEENRAPHIGRIVGDRDGPVIRIGDYPDGTNVESYARATVTVREQGVVRDFIKFVPRFPSWVPKMAGREMWPWVFNVADAALVCGVLMLLMFTVFDRRPRA